MLQWPNDDGMVPDDTLHKGTSKCHKMDEKTIHFAVHVSPSFFLKYPLQQSPIQKWSRIFNLVLFPIFRQNLHHRFVTFFGLVPTPKKCLSLCIALFFCFILVHTRVIRVRNYYLIIYTTKKKNFTWMLVLNYLIGILSFF